MGILVAKGDPEGAAKVRRFFQIALQRESVRGIEDVADTLVASQVEGLPELKIPSSHPLATTADRIFTERRVPGTRLVTV